MLCLMGGADVSPILYQEQRLPCTFTDPEQDMEDAALFATFRDRPKVGICRGGQFLNVMSGGKMFQDTDNHTSSHDIIDHKTEKIIKVSSTHHQMMRPGVKAEIIATARRSSYVRCFDGYIFRKDVEYEDYEVLHYAHTKSLCYQPHPEIGPDENVDYFFSCIHEYLGV
jgi:gamma-glutamyl-gamma-aminobutyrate hydrolase PuuD